MRSKHTEHHVLMTSTGGTIGGHVAIDDEGDPDYLKHDAESFDRMLARTRARLEERIDKAIVITPYIGHSESGADMIGLCDIDSSDIKQHLWTRLAEVIADNFDSYDSFIITHGTNTLGYTCAALSFAIANSGKPIVLTGSQVPADQPGSDALTNLENALRVATWQPDDREEARIEGVLAVFGSAIITGTRVTKDTEFDFDAFKSFGVGSIGRIGRIIHINQPALAKHRQYLRTPKYNRALRRRDLVVAPLFSSEIVSLTELPGMDSSIFRTLVEKCNVKGFILHAFGAGDPAGTLRPAFEYLKERRIPIVVTTQAPNGNSNFQVNDPGKWLRENQMAIPAYDMRIEAQTTKLGWLLAKYPSGSERDYQAICDGMIEDMRGEVNPIWEI